MAPSCDRRYRALASDAAPDVQCVGRLAAYRYYMDQVVAQALTLYNRIAGRAADQQPAIVAAAG